MKIELDIPEDMHELITSLKDDAYPDNGTTFNDLLLVLISYACSTYWREKETQAQETDITTNPKEWN